MCVDELSRIGEAAGPLVCLAETRFPPDIVVIVCTQPCCVLRSAVLRPTSRRPRGRRQTTRRPGTSHRVGMCEGQGLQRSLTFSMPLEFA